MLRYYSVFPAGVEPAFLLLPPAAWRQPCQGEMGGRAIRARLCSRCTAQV